MTENRTTRRLSGILLWISVAGSLFGAGLSGFLFDGKLIDLVLIQLVFYGAWSALLGSWAGGLLGAAVEEDACSEMDMGVTSSMGAFIGAISASLVADAAVGLAGRVGWKPVWVGALVVTLVAAALYGKGQAYARRSSFAGRMVPGLRMRDRLSVVTVLSVLAMLGLTGFMAATMGSDLGNPVMLAPMAYAMTGGMLGGILGGWFAGLADEHRGLMRHENVVMVGGMALMSGMMGAMPASMTGGMMAVMGGTCLWSTVATGLVLGAIFVGLVLDRRHRVRRAAASPEEAITIHDDGKEVRRVYITVSGMTCDACGRRVAQALTAVDGVRSAEVDVGAGRAVLECSPEFSSTEALSRALDEAGYQLGGAGRGAA